MREDMDRIFDIHNHSIWGVDDGADSLETSIRMLEMACKSGTTDIILTPHNKPGRRNVYYQEMKDIIEQLEQELKSRDIALRLHSGNEIYYRMDVAERLKIGKASTMAESKYVLLEYNPVDEWDYIKRGVDDMLAEGYWPIVAHVERYENVMKDLDRAQDLINKGCYLQINASSVMGDIGWKYKKACKELLDMGMVSFVASDAHDIKKRNPRLDKCVKYINKKYGAEYAQNIFCKNPLKIIDNEII